MNLKLNLIAAKTIVRKEVIRVMRIWVQTIVPPAITMTLYFIIFGNLIGRRIGSMDGFDYMQYIAPGLIMMSVITNSYGNVVSSFFGAKFGRHIEEMLVSPMSNGAIIIGHVAGGVLRGLFVGGLATDYCVKFTALDARELGYHVTVRRDAVRGVDLNPGDSDRALAEMQSAGVTITG